MIYGRVATPATMYEPSSGNIVYISSGNEVAAGCAKFKTTIHICRELKRWNGAEC